METVANECAVLAELRYWSKIGRCNLGAARAFAHQAACLIGAGRTFRAASALHVPAQRIAEDLRHSVALLQRAAELAEEYDEESLGDDLEYAVIFGVTGGILRMREVNRGVDSDVALVRLLEPDGPLLEAVSLWQARCRAGLSAVADEACV